MKKKQKPLYQAAATHPKVGKDQQKPGTVVKNSIQVKESLQIQYVNTAFPILGVKLE